MDVTLANVPEGDRVVVVNVAGGRGVRRRLLEMGFAPGSEVEVIANKRGPVVVRVRGVTVALGRGMAAKILVKPVGGGDGWQQASVQGSGGG